MPLVYEQLEEESAPAFAAFVIYRDMGDNRSLEAVAKQVDKNVSLIRRWSAENKWVPRARAWDLEEDRVKREAHLKMVAAMSERHAQLAVRLQAKLAKRLENLDPDELSPRELAQWLEISVKVERLARGVATDNVHQEITGSEGKAIEVEMNSKTFSPKDIADILNTMQESGALDDSSQNYGGDG